MRKTLASLTAAVVATTAGLAASTPATAATPTLRFHGAQYDSPGRDTRSNASLNAEWISLINTGSTAVNLKGYTIRDKANHVYTIRDNVTIAARGGRFWLKTGKGTASARTRYWGSGNYVWNNDGDTAYLRRSNGTTVDTCSWTYQKDRTWVAC